MSNPKTIIFRKELHSNVINSVGSPLWGSLFSVSQLKWTALCSLYATVSSIHRLLNIILFVFTLGQQHLWLQSVEYVINNGIWTNWTLQCILSIRLASIEYILQRKTMKRITLPKLFDLLLLAIELLLLIEFIQQSEEEN